MRTAGRKYLGNGKHHDIEVFLHVGRSELKRGPILFDRDLRALDVVLHGVGRGLEVDPLQARLPKRFLQFGRRVLDRGPVLAGSI